MTQKFQIFQGGDKKRAEKKAKQNRKTLIEVDTRLITLWNTAKRWNRDPLEICKITEFPRSTV